MSPITSLQIYSDDEIEATADRSSFGGRTKTKRESSKNELTVQYGTKYRDPDNTRELMGKLQPLGKAFAIVAVCIYGPNLPSESFRHNDRKLIWRSAAQYCMTEDTIDSILEQEKNDHVCFSRRIRILGQEITAAKHNSITSTRSMVEPSLKSEPPSTELYADTYLMCQ